MAEPATRVALLARPGAACDNLQAALRQAGADVVAVQDPGDGDPDAIAAARPGAVLVALEPAVEDALARYDAVLSEPGRLVIYDEVAIAARREGWDAARWARHLAAKLGGHADVLPPGAGSDEDADVALVEREGPAFPAREDVAFPAREDVTAAPLPSVLEPDHGEALASAAAGIDFGGFTPEIMASMAMEPMPEAFDADAVVEAPGPSPGTAPVGDANVLEWDAPMEAPEAPAPHPIEPAPTMSAAAPAAAQAEAPAPVRFSLDEMALVDMEPADAAPSAPAALPEPPAAVAPAVPFAAPAMPAGDGGAVVVLAGIGGPDAVRQFLAALPAGFARPIVVRQRLDGGRHDRLVRQMQRATALPVELAEAGRALVPGHVYILPDGMTTSGDGAATFVATDAGVPALAGLPAGRSAVLVLSGSDPAAVPELMEAARDGAFVAGQSPEDSFDGAAATALVAAGGESCTATELAQRVSARWQS